MIEINEKALKEFDNIVLLHGSHKDVSDGVCAMEAVAWLAGEKHSDSPQCACPALTRMVQRLNDRWDDVQRQALKPYLRRLIGTRDSSKLMARGFMAADWAVRNSMPRWLDYLDMPLEAAEMRALPALVDKESALGASLASRRARAAILRKYPAAAYAYAAYAYAAYAAAAYAYAAYAYAAAAYAAAGSSKQVAFQAHVHAQNASVLDLLDRMIRVGEQS